MRTTNEICDHDTAVIDGLPSQWPYCQNIWRINLLDIWGAWECVYHNLKMSDQQFKKNLRSSTATSSSLPSPSSSSFASSHHPQQHQQQITVRRYRIKKHVSPTCAKKWFSPMVRRFVVRMNLIVKYMVHVRISIVVILPLIVMLSLLKSINSKLLRLPFSKENKTI